MNLEKDLEELKSKEDVEKETTDDVVVVEETGDVAPEEDNIEQ